MTTRTRSNPITIDPLTSSRLIAPGDTTDLALAREEESASSNVLVVYTMRYARSDWDSFAFLCDHDFQNPHLVHADISTAWNSWVKDAAYAGGADRFVFAAVTRDAGYTGPTIVRVHFHDRGDRRLNSAVAHVLPTQHPQWQREGLVEKGVEGDGLRIFRNAVDFVR